MAARCYRVAEHVASFETDVPGLAGFVDDLLEGFPASAGSAPSSLPVDGHYSIFRRGTGVTVDLDGFEYHSQQLAPALGKLLRHLSYTAVCSVHDHLVIHAGVVSFAGRAVVLPAPSGHGKTTLTAALVRAGWEYLSDEAALVDLATGVVHPFPRPLGMSVTSLRRLGCLDELDVGLEWSEAEERQIAPSRLRPGCIGSRAPLSALVAPRYEPGVRSRAEGMRRSEAMRVAISNSVNFKSFGRSGLSRLANVIGGIDVYRLAVDDLDVAVGEIRSLVEG